MDINSDKDKKIKWNNIQKVALGIVAFEGTEHLYNIIYELRDHLDLVIVGLQKVSYHGDPISQLDLNEINRLCYEDRIVDKILEVDIDGSLLPRQQETEKRNAIIEYAEKQGCSHILVIDSDEYYTKSSFIRGLKQIDENNYEQTYCQYINYYHDYMHFLIYPFKDGMYVPFITKTCYRYGFESTDFPLPSDPTRRYLRDKKTVQVKNQLTGIIEEKEIYTVDYHVFQWNEVKMHHLSWVRADIRKKLNMWSSKTLFDHYWNLIDKAVYNFNHFDENSTAEQQAIMLFNTPGNKVDIGTFPKQYIHPVCDINTRLRPCKDYKRLLFINLGTTKGNGLFIKLEKACRQTWAADILAGKYTDCDYWNIIDTEKESYIDKTNHTIYIKNYGFKDDRYEMIQRYNNGVLMLEKEGIKYDYIIRTNTSTWINVDLMRSFLADEQNDSILYSFEVSAAYWSLFNIYGTGQMFIISKRNQEIIQFEIKASQLDKKELAQDDVMISSIFYTNCIVNNIPQHLMIKGLDCEYLKNDYKHTDFDSIDFRKIAYQIKTFTLDEWIRNINDEQKYLTLHEYWKNKKNVINIDNIAENIRKNNIDYIYLQKESKQEWFKIDQETKKNIHLNRKKYKSSEIQDILADLRKRDGYDKIYEQIQKSAPNKHKLNAKS